MNRSDLNTLVSNEEAATRFLRRLRGNSALAAWPNLLWGMALLGLLLLPSHYRAGAESVHGHSLVQLWIDAGDGTILHAHHHPASDSGTAVATSWLDPLVGDPALVKSTAMEDERPDVADHQESTPVASGLHLLLVPTPVAPLMGRLLPPEGGPELRVAGLSPRIALPPPRWTSYAT